MQTPLFAELQREHEETGPGVRSFCTGKLPPSVGPTYDHWVFHRSAAAEGAGFLSDEHAIGREEARKLVERLVSNGESCWVYNRRVA